MSTTTTRKQAHGRPRPKLTLGPQVAEFFRRRIRHSAGPLIGQPVILEPWQRDDLDLIFEVDAHGRRVWQRVLWGQARGNGKTPVVGGISLLELVSWDDAPRVFAAAGARDQANLLLEFTRPNVEQGPLSDHLTARAKAVLSPRNLGVMRVISADGDLQHGLSVSFAGIDELHVIKTEKQREMVYALETALKRPNSWTAAITTAGKHRRSMLGQRYEAALAKSRDVWTSDDGTLTIARDPDSRSLMIWRGMPAGADIADERLWRAVNPASWVDMDYLRAQAHYLPRGVFRRLHLNMWAEGSDTAIPGGLWDACADPAAAVIGDGADVWLAVAMSERTDSGVLVAVGRPAEGDGRRPVWAHIIGASADGSSVNEVAAAQVRAAAARWRVMSLAFNPLHFGAEASALGLEGIRLYRREGATDPGFREVGETMAPASRELVAAVADRRLAHDGSPEVREQVTAACAQVSAGAWRIVRPRAEDGPDTDTQREPDRAEAAIGLVMAWAAAGAPASPYETRGIQVI